MDNENNVGNENLETIIEKTEENINEIQKDTEQVDEIKEDIINDNEQIKEQQIGVTEEKQEMLNNNDKKKSNKKIFIIPIIIVLLLSISFIVYKYLEKTSTFEILSIKATKFDGAIIGNDSSFIIETKDGTLDDVKKHIYLSPALDYDIKSVGINKYRLDVLGDIADNTLLNIDYIENEVPEYKWAFQTKKDLSVSNIYPADSAEYVSENSIIEIMFSYPEVEGVEENFEISPEVAGTFSHEGRIYKFTPTEELKSSTTYTIRIKPGVKYNDIEMKDEFVSTFSTYKNYNDNIYIDSPSIRNINTFLETERPIVKIGGYKVDMSSITKISVYQISDANDFISYLKNQEVDMKYIGDYDFTVDDKLLILNKTLKEGYYVFYLKTIDDSILLKANIQVNNLSAYALTTQRDLLVWVAKDGKLQENVKINCSNRSEKTNKDGYYIFKNVVDDSDEIAYLTVDGTIPLIIDYVNIVDNTKKASSYIYTDRPLYKPTDKINIWGYVPIEHFSEDVDYGAFSLYLNNEKTDVNINKDGTFMTSFNLDNYFQENYFPIELKYKNEIISRRYVNIENYITSDYEYNIITDKEYYKAGENIELEVDVNHITGLSAPYKNIVVTFDENDYYGVTDESGKAYFTLPISLKTNQEMYSNSIYGNSKSIKVKSSGVDYSNNSITKYIKYYDSDILIDSSGNNYDNSLEKIKFEVSNINFENRIADNPLTSEYNGSATLEIHEIRHKRIFTGYKYNEYTKENYSTYDYSSDDILIKTQNISIKNGIFVYTYDKIFTKSTKNEYSSYEAILKITDKNNNIIKRTITYYYGEYLDDDKDKKESSNSTNAIDGNSYMESSNKTNASYHLYNYAMIDPENNGYYNYWPNRYSIGEKIPLILRNYQGKVENNGKLLQIAYRENILDTKIVDDNNLSYEFTKLLYPGSNITGAYLQNSKFYRTPQYYYDYDEEDSKLNIEIKTNKVTYNPGEKVTGTLKITDKNGNPITTKANISVVNEKIFNIEEDSTGILNTIFSNKIYSAYTFSTYYDYSLHFEEGGRGATGGSGRSNFGDTVYFDMIEAKNGAANFSFNLNDDISEFRITVHAAGVKDDIVYVGVDKSKIKTSLPLAIASTRPQGVKNTDDLVINATPITGNNVDITFKIKELDKEITKSTTLNKPATANFGKLEVGKYHVVISAIEGNNTDSMEYEVEVSETNQEIPIKQTDSIKNNTNIKPTKNPIILEIYNEKMESYIKLLDHLKNNYTARLDTQIAYYKALEYEKKYYGKEDNLTKPEFKNEGSLLKNLTNSSDDYILTGLAAYYASEYFNFKPSDFQINTKDKDETIIKKLFVLSAMKEPVLIELNSINKNYLDEEERLLLAISYAFLGDYDDASMIYSDIDEEELYDDQIEDLYDILVTFIDKSNALSLIENALDERKESEYLNFAILSFFENNNAELSKEEHVRIKSKDIDEKISINGLTVKSLTIYTKDLANLNFKTTSKNIKTTYYYRGKVEDPDGSKQIINASIDGELKVGKEINLNLDISYLTRKNGTINISLPNSLRLNTNFENKKGLYLNTNNNSNIKLSLTNYYESNNITIPLYVILDGNYEIEPIVIKQNDDYYISNNITIDISM